MRLENKVAIVVGGGQTLGETMGNGRAVALTFAREGATVLVVDRDLASADETVAMIAQAGGTASALPAEGVRGALRAHRRAAQQRRTLRG